MAKSWFPLGNLAGITIWPDEFWAETTHHGWITIFVLAIIFIWQFPRAFLKQRNRGRSVQNDAPEASRVRDSPNRIPDIVSDEDLANLINELEGKFSEKENWDDIIDRKNHLLSYNAKCCKPKDGPLKYVSVTTFENCSAEQLRDFYMDNEYRKEWDKMLVEHEQLQVYEINGTEIGHLIKKFPLLTPREYVLAWRVWEAKDESFYCFIKDCDHALAPRIKKYVRVGIFRSGWRIRKVPGRDASEIKMVHQEDAGINAELAKLLFAKGIWSYVCKMDTALRKYSSRCCTGARMTLSALDLMQRVLLNRGDGGEDLGKLVCSPSQSISGGFFLNPRFQYEEGFVYSDDIRSGVTKVIERLAPNVTFAIEATREVPPELETMAQTIRQCCSEISMENPVTETGGETGKKFLIKPSKKWIVKGLLVLGGVICLSRGHGHVVKKVAVVCILNKLVGHGAPSREAALSRDRERRSLPPLIK